MASRRGAPPQGVADHAREALDGIFGQRYPASTLRGIRTPLVPAQNHVPFAGLVHPDSLDSGAYGGMSLVWFPVPGDETGSPVSLLTFVCGTRGLAPDDQILGRPGHARHLHALRRYLANRCGVRIWTKHDPANLSQALPQQVRDELFRFKAALDQYGHFIYAAVEVPRDERAREVTAAFLDYYAWERGWRPLAAIAAEVEGFRNALRTFLFPRVTRDDLMSLLRERRFVVLQGPPGTGKTRLAGELLREGFSGRGRVVQFHPAVTYETFVAGLSPDVKDAALRFDVKPGWLVEANREASKPENSDYLLVVDEINRGDLGRVLGEAIYLFEPRDITDGVGRTVHLPHPLEDGSDTLTLSQGLYVLGTMNTADRSIAILDMAVRRRFAFVDVWPDAEVVNAQGLELATKAFGLLQDIFAQYAPDDALTLLPGHAYFLAKTHEELVRRLRFELLPLLREYLQEGRLGPCESELRAYSDWLEGEISRDAPEA